MRKFNFYVIVDNQRQQYRRLKQGMKSSLNEDRIKRLEQEDFVWDDDDVDNVENNDDDEREEMGKMMRRGYHGLVQSIYSSS